MTKTNGDEDGSIERRGMLAALGAAGAVGTAGCLGSLGGGGEAEVEITEEVERSRAEIADHLESMAALLRGEEQFEIEVDGETISVAPVDSPTYQIQIEDERVDGEIEREVGFTVIYPRTDAEESLPTGEL